MSYRTIYKARLYRKRVTKANPHPLVLVFWDVDSSGTWSRVFQHQGIYSEYLAEREVTSEENDVLMDSWRLRSVKYASWDSLIKDEEKITADPKWVAKLRELAAGGK